MEVFGAMAQLQRSIHSAFANMNAAEAKISKAQQELHNQLLLVQQLNGAQGHMGLLRVGGLPFHIDTRALASHPESMLATLFKEQFYIDRDPEGYAVVDRSPRLFNLVRAYLIDSGTPVPTEAEHCRALHDEALYYGLPDLTHRVRDLPIIWVMGGLTWQEPDGALRPTSKAEVYRFQSSEWEEMAPLPNLSRLEAAVVVHDGCIYICGGALPSGEVVPWVDIWEVSTNSWHHGPPLNVARRAAAAVAVGHEIWVIGGCQSVGSAVATIEVLSNGTWCQSVPPLTTCRRSCGAAVIGGCAVVVVGGEDTFGTPMHSGEMFCAASGRWSPLPDLPTAVASCGAAEWAGTLVVAGGHNELDEPRNDVFQYLPASQKWSMISRLSTNRDACALVTADGRLFAIGGNDGKNPLATVEEYVPQNGCWKPMPPMHIPRDGCCSAALLPDVTPHFTRKDWQ